ncbi:MAG: hypothetical protein M2R45_01612 [Verrucomicrobia subdivision 3 bacterium]|nr:hypothetical protein [Limisphaerales bacterium]MCS1412764.1 hypothetical protein [Limisphaerales bacterium]
MKEGMWTQTLTHILFLSACRQGVFSGRFADFTVHELCWISVDRRQVMNLNRITHE